MESITVKIDNYKSDSQLICFIDLLHDALIEP